MTPEPLPPITRRAAVTAIALGVGGLAGCSLLPGRSAPGSPRPQPAPAPIPTLSAAPVTSIVEGVRIPGYWRPTAAGRPSGSGVVPYERLAVHGPLRSALELADRQQVSFLPGRYTFRDFVSAGYTKNGLDLDAQVGGLRGSGVGRTVFAMVPHTSTHAGDIPHGFPNTNALSLLRLTGDGLRLSGFTLEGTDQGHLYNGIQLQRSRNLRMSDVRVVAVPGDDSKPPGETFGINDYLTAGSVYERVEVDGAHVGATGFGANDSVELTLQHCWFHDQRFSMGAAFWQVRNVTIIDSIATGNGGAGFNFERVDGTVRLVRPVTAGNRWADIRIASDLGSVSCTIIDPVYAGPKLTIAVPPTYYGRRNQQLLTDVRVMVRGVDRTEQVVRFLQ
jgi:hypothetical protein